MKSLRNSRGITILELLIVVGIIGLIAGLSVPTFQSIMHKTRRTRMFAQLKLLSDDQALYERDHGTFYPELLAFTAFPPDQPMTLHGQGKTLPGGSRYYTYYIYRFEPLYPEPIIYAYAHQALGNDLDGDPFPDLWVKMGSGPPQRYMDDLDNSLHAIRLQ